MKAVATRRPVVRIIQHLSCTGGTLICRCLTAMYDVALLSEVNPHSRLHTEYPRFSPTDMSYLAIIGGFPKVDELSKKIFLADIKIIIEHLQPFAKQLVIRDHSHSDYLVEKIVDGAGTTRSLLHKDYDLKSILSIRHPVDSYLSMLLRDWVKFTPANFDEFCRRYLLFIERNKPHTLFKYEDFVAAPEKEIKNMCAALAIKFDDGFLEKMDLVELTGDSGRRSGSVIAPRKRREYDSNFAKEVEQSIHFRKICEKFDYSPDLSNQP